jgi:hypothetical protein
MLRSSASESASGAARWCDVTSDPSKPTGMAPVFDRVPEA